MFQVNERSRFGISYNNSLQVRSDSVVVYKYIKPLPRQLIPLYNLFGYGNKIRWLWFEQDTDYHDQGFITKLITCECRSNRSYFKKNQFIFYLGLPGWVNRVKTSHLMLLWIWKKIKLMIIVFKTIWLILFEPCQQIFSHSMPALSVYFLLFGSFLGWLVDVLIKIKDWK